MDAFKRPTIETPIISDRINWVVREMEAKDDKDYLELMTAEPERGWIDLRTAYKPGQSPYELLTRRRSQKVFVVQVPEGMKDAGKVVGVGAADPRRVWFEGLPLQAVHLHNLLVHPDYRHKGIATQLIQARVRWARSECGPNILIFAELNQNDPAAFRAAAKWATDFTQPRESGFLLARSQPPPNPDGYVVREAEEADYPTIVNGLNTFNHDVDFTRVVDSERLHRNLSPINGRIFRHRYVVLANGKIVGGAVLSEHDPTVEAVSVRGKPINMLLARLSGMIHEGGEVRYGEVDGIWYQPGFQNAEHYLVHTLLHRAKLDRNTTDALNFTIINHKVWEAVQLPRWQPHTIECVAYLRPAELEPLRGIQFTPAW